MYINRYIPLSKFDTEFVEFYCEKLLLLLPKLRLILDISDESGMLNI